MHVAMKTPLQTRRPGDYSQSVWYSVAEEAFQLARHIRFGVFFQ